MDGKTLSEAMGARLSLSRYNELAPAVTKALGQAECITLERAAMFLAQIGHESWGLQYMEEIASGAAYEGRKSLGNVKAGDGKRFKGRGPIQVTGRTNYTNCSKWAHSKGYVPTATYFVDHPEQLATVKYGFIGTVWYWLSARNMNAYADRKDLRGATKAINGAYNGLTDRTERYNRCLKMGQRIFTPRNEGELIMASNKEIEDVAKKVLQIDGLIPNVFTGNKANKFVSLATALTEIGKDNATILKNQEALNKKLDELLKKK